MRRLPFYYGWIVVAVIFVIMANGVNARSAISLFFAPNGDEFAGGGLTAARSPSLPGLRGVSP